MKAIIGTLIALLLLWTSCTFPTSGPQVGTGTAPPDFYLHQNYPNPFNDTTVVEYGVPSSGGSGSTVSLIVFNRFEEAVRVLAYNSHHPSGNFTTKWDGRTSRGSAAPPGVYIIEMRGYSPQVVIIRKIAVKNR